MGGAIAARGLRGGTADGNKRTALLLARWTLDRDGIDGANVIPPGDRVVADLLVRAAKGDDVEASLIRVFTDRHG